MHLIRQYTIKSDRLCFLSSICVDQNKALDIIDYPHSFILPFDVMRHYIASVS